MSNKAPSAVAVKALAKANYIARICKPQIKRNDTAFAINTITNAGRIELMPQCPEGVSNNHRIGNNIRLVELQVRCQLFRNTSATTSFIRLLVIRDKQQVADSKMGIADILSVVQTTSPYNSATKGRFSIVRDKVVDLDANHPGHSFSWKIKLNITQRYNGALSTDIQKNGFYFGMLSNQGTFFPTIEWIARMLYHDA